MESLLHYIRKVPGSYPGPVRDDSVDHYALAREKIGEDKSTKIHGHSHPKSETKDKSDPRKCTSSVQQNFKKILDRLTRVH